MKRVFALLMLFLFLLSLTGCSNWEEPQEDDFFQIMSNYYNKSETEDETPALTSFALPYLDGETAAPYTCLDGAQRTLGGLLYESLYVLDPAFVPQPSLAQSYVCSADGRTYTITLHRGVYFSDGTEMTARDVVYSLKQARSSQRYGARLAEVSSISGSEYTVTITLRQANAGFLARLDVPIVKNGTAGRTWPTGTGPYRYVSDDTGEHLALNSRWWQDHTLPLARIELVRCKDSDIMSYAFYTREIQLLLCDLTATDAPSVSGSGAYTDAATTTLQFIGINTARSHLSDPALRAALNLGIDRQGCINAFLLGHGLAAQFPVSPASALYPQALETPYSPDHFDTAMAQAGYSSGGTVRLTMLVNKENSFKVDAARRIAEDLSRHDLQITVKALPWEQYLLALQNGNYDLYYGECRLTADWDLRSLIGTGGSLNYSGYTNADTDALLSAYLSADDAGREAAMLELCRHLSEQAPILPVCFKSVSMLLPSGAVENAIPTAANPFYNLAQWKIDIAE